jgi:hypothetical protein
VNRTIKWITAERARDHLFSRLVASIGSPELFDTDRLVTESLSKARQEVRDALTLGIETTCQGAGRNRNDVDRDDEKHGCEDCGHPVAGPMLHDAIWATIAEKITLRPARSVGAGGIRHIIGKFKLLGLDEIHAAVDNDERAHRAIIAVAAMRAVVRRSVEQVSSCFGSSGCGRFVERPIGLRASGATLALNH